VSAALAASAVTLMREGAGVVERPVVRSQQGETASPHTPHKRRLASGPKRVFSQAALGVLLSEP
jgi:hypothetical protein